MKTNNEASAQLELSRDSVLSDITKIVAEHMDIPPQDIGENDHLINDVGCDSLDITEILMMIEEHFDIDVPEDLAQDASTTGEVTDGVLKFLANATNT